MVSCVRACTLCSLRYFSESLKPNITKFYYICLSTVTMTEFYRQMCTTLGLESDCHKASMFRNIQKQLELVGASSKILDENAMLAAYGSCGGSIRKLNLILTKSLIKIRCIE